MWCVIVPTYNNGRTIREVALDIRRYTSDVIVVNDGCTDDTDAQLAGTGVTIVHHDRNQGKGYALRTGFEYARKAGFEYAITLDADGQHFASDIPAFLKAHELSPDSLIIGSRNLTERNMPAQNTFANKFSNFWFKLQTGITLPDTQTGFRLYPLRKIGKLRWITSRYEAELEMLVYAAWKGIRIIPIPVRVYYPPSDERVSHFRPIYDFARISLLNTVLCFLAVVYGFPAKFARAINKRLVRKTVSPSVYE